MRDSCFRRKDRDFVSDDNLFNYQAKVIKELASKETCVIIGRCADYVLKDYPNVVSVFIHADRKVLSGQVYGTSQYDRKRNAEIH